MTLVARRGDSVSMTCNVHGSVTGTFFEGSSILNILGVEVVLVGHRGNASCGHQFKAITGAALGDVNGTPIVRVNDQVQMLVVGGTGVVTSGSPIFDIA